MHKRDMLEENALSSVEERETGDAGIGEGMEVLLSLTILSSYISSGKQLYLAYMAGILSIG